MYVVSYKVPRAPIEEFSIRGKKYLDPESFKIILEDDKTFAEEKLDGRQITIEEGNYLIFCEDLKITHTIYYSDLPSYLYCFDVYYKNRFLDPVEKHIVILSSGLFPARIIARGPFTREDTIRLVLYTKSAFGSRLNPKMLDIIIKGIQRKELELKYINPNSEGFIEGIVLKNYDYLIFAKVVNPDFEHIIDYVGGYEKFSYRNRVTYWGYKRMEEYLLSNLNKIKSVYPNHRKMSELEKLLKKYLSKYI